MLTKIPILTCLAFAVIYPLCFWISCQDPLKNKFHRFHVGVANVIGGVALVALLPLPFDTLSKTSLLLWFALLFIISAYVWNKDYPPAALITIPCLIGLAAFIQVQNQMIGPPSLQLAVVGILSGLVLCSSLFAMNLGHWYLNVHGLPIGHLLRATYVFWGLVAIRLLWDIKEFLTAKILYQGDWLPLYQFLFHLDGFLLLIALFFGTLFPLIALYFVKGTLEVKSTQSATGILYVILSAVLIGDITYKYYLIKYGVYL
jgi:hypothetical protein